MGRKLSAEIKGCEKWSLVFVDPEHLKDPEWREITEWPVFRANIVFGCVDEAHLIYEWGLDFRLAFLLIGAFFRGRLPTRTSVLALSATMQPGAHESFVLNALGFVRNTYTLIRRSNERPNIQFSIETLSHGLGGSEFPSLLPYLNSGRKLAIHCKDINLVTRVFSYCGRRLAPGEDWFRRIRTYHALYSAEHNEATLDDMINDDECQVIIATVAFANGLNVKTLLDSISLGVGDSTEQTWQQMGRAGRMTGTLARGVMLVQPAVVTTAAARIKGKSSISHANH
jgi:superfamily II DNA helicase RecQ